MGLVKKIWDWITGIDAAKSLWTWVPTMLSSLAVTIWTEIEGMPDSLLFVLFIILLAGFFVIFSSLYKLLQYYKSNIRKGFEIHLTERLGDLWDAEILCAVSIKHNLPESLSDCLVQIEEIDKLHNNLMPIPFVLRTEGQIRNDGKGRFKLTRNQPKKIPVFSKISKRRDEWRFVDENKKQYFINPRDIKMIIGVYGGNISKKILLEISVASDWKAKSTIKIVKNNYSLS